MSIIEESINNCFWFQNNKKNAMYAILSGILFFTGWWLMIDAIMVYPEAVNSTYLICGIIGTVSMVMVNIIPSTELYEGLSNGVKIWLFIGFVLGFSSVIASCWIFFANYVGKSDSVWSGIALLLQNIFIFGSSLFYKFGREETYY